MVKQQLNRLSKEDYEVLRELCHIAKNLTNQAIYNARQYFFETGKYLNYPKNNALLKDSENYKTLNSNMSQQILMEVDGEFQSYFALKKLAKEGKYDGKVRLPHYLPKDGYTTLVVGFVRLKGNTFTLPYSIGYKKEHKPVTIKMPPIMKDRAIKEIRIIPKSNARFFEIQYVYEAECIQRKLNPNLALGIDLGINNLVTAVTNTGKSFIIDGKRLKSINQWYNKENARLQSIKDLQHYGEELTPKQAQLLRKRNNRVDDYISKVAKMVVNYCVANCIGILVFGYNKSFQSDPDLGKKNNQNFVNIPFGKLKKKVEYLCKLNGITFVEQEESYTSKASFWDKDEIPVYTPGDETKYVFSGKRIKRGLYRCANGRLINADLNGALNILRKSKVVDLTVLYNSGVVETPVRLRVV
jgi:IS605 OrfB family transposase